MRNVEDQSNFAWLPDQHAQTNNVVIGVVTVDTYDLLVRSQDVIGCQSIFN